MSKEVIMLLRTRLKAAREKYLIAIFELFSLDLKTNFLFSVKLTIILMILAKAVERAVVTVPPPKEATEPIL